MNETVLKLLDTDLTVKFGPRFKELAGQKFGRLRVLSLKGFLAYKDSRQAVWICICDCKNRKLVRSSKLLSGGTKSCGCLRREAVAAKNTTHGGSYSKTFICWQAMLRRCSNPNIPEWPRYGGRGITVCERWKKFENFREDMGERPSLNHSLDRFPDNDGNYDKSNCRWATYSQQNRNRRSNHNLTIGDRTMTITEWSEHSGVSKNTITGRLNLGWCIEKAVFHPVTIRQKSVSLRAQPSLPSLV